MSDTKEPGCGWTQQRIVNELLAKGAQQYEEGLMRVGVKPTKRQTLVTGYRDGLRDAIRHLEGMGVLVVLPDSQ